MVNEIRPDTRILFQPEIEAMGGAERSMLALAGWLHRQAIDCSIVVYADHVGIERFAEFPLKVVQLRPRMEPFRKVAALRKCLGSQPAGVKPLLSGYQSALHASLANIRGTHCLMHDTPDLFQGDSALAMKAKMRMWLSNKLVGRNLRSGGQTIVTSEHLQRECKKLFGVDAEIARMGGLYNPSEFTCRTVDRELRLLSVSRVEPNKRIDWILRALATLERDASPLSSRVDWSLDVIGEGTQLASLSALAQESGLAERVRFLGRISDAELQKAYAESHLFLMPAVQGYGIPAIEALARGIPVLLHRDSGVSDILLRTPWATVITGGEENMLPGLRTALEDVIEGRHMSAPPPQLPTEDEWAMHVAKLCGWTTEMKGERDA